MDMCDITTLSHLSSELEVKKKVISEKSQTEKDKYCIFAHLCGIQKVKQMSKYNKIETNA